jgi:hypothetical protein
VPLDVPVVAAVDVVAAVVLVEVVPAEEAVTVVAAEFTRPIPSPATAATAAMPVTAVVWLTRVSSRSRLVGVQGSVMSCS